MRKDLRDIGYTIVATVDAYHVEYRIYELVGYTVPEDRPLFLKKGWKASSDLVECLDDAEPAISGSVKWDGCSDWKFDEAEQCCMHECDRAGLVAVGQVLAACWDWTKELLPTWQGDE